MISRRVGGGGAAGCAAGGAAAAGGGAPGRRRLLRERDVAQDLGRERRHDPGVEEFASVHDVL